MFVVIVQVCTAFQNSV